MSYPKEIFRSYDIRGLLEQVTPDIAQHVGYALTKLLDAKVVLIGRDMRATSGELAQAAARGAQLAGAQVRDIGLCTTSLFNYAVSSTQEVQAGLMITASHNPASYNGIKMARFNGLPVSGVDIFEALEQYPLPDTEIDVAATNYPVLEAYLDACIAQADVPDLTGTKIVVDYGNGMGSVTIRPLLERLGVEVIELYAEPDPNFPNHEANPAKEETLADVKARVLDEEADFGVAIDGDGDRIGFIDNEGNSLRGDQVLAILAEFFLAEQPKARIVTAPNHGWAPIAHMRELGAEILEERIGRTNVIKRMFDDDALLGGEISSHFFYKSFSNLEAIDYTLALILSIWKRSGTSFADIAAPMRQYVNSGEVNTEVDDKDTVMSAIRERYSGKATVVNECDGFRMEFEEEWWFIVRPSNTEPLLRLTVEAVSQELVDNKVAEITAMMNE